MSMPKTVRGHEGTQRFSASNGINSPSQLLRLMSHYVYVLESDADSEKYVGCTNNFKRRIDDHNRGKVFSTKLRKPFKLIICLKS